MTTKLPKEIEQAIDRFARAQCLACHDDGYGTPEIGKQTEAAYEAALRDLRAVIADALTKSND